MKVLEPEMIFPGEEIVHTTGYHWIYVFRSFLPLALIVVLGTIAWSFVPTRPTSVIIMLALLVAISWIVVKVMDTIIKRCYITNRRLINRSGWTQRATQDVTLDKIGGMFLDQTPMERLLGYGRVKLIVPIIQIPLPEYLRNPVAFRNAIYVKAAKPEEKPDDDAMADEHDRLAREEDDRFGAETVSLKDLQEMAENVESDGLGANLGADLGTSHDTDLAMMTEDDALIEAGADAESALETADTGTDGGGDAGDDGTT